MLVGYAPGGGMDTIARVLAPKLSEALGQQFVIENRPGASGGVAAEALLRSASDGYMLMVAESGTLALPAILDHIEDSPSLARYPGEVFGRCYSTAREQAAAETALPRSVFPETSPYTVEQALDPDFLPD